jgi:peptidoglycan/xylan/chitin deacetylase (PgdA/CDA1 family)
MMTAPCWIVFYHYLRSAPTGVGNGIRALSPEDFQRQLDWIGSRAEIIDYQTFAMAVTERRGFARPTALLTFDDGLADHLVVGCSELARRGLSGLFFVNGDPLNDTPKLVNVHRTHLLLDHLGAPPLLAEIKQRISGATDHHSTDSSGLYRYDGEPEQVLKRLLNYELPYEQTDAMLRELVATYLGDEATLARRFYLSPDDVRYMTSQGMAFGYHTRRHRVMSRLDAAGQRDELTDGVNLVQSLTGQTSVPFCYPYGHRQTFDGRCIELLEELGYSMAFTTGRQPAQPAVDGRFVIPRYDTVDLPPRGTTDVGVAQVFHP